MQPFSSRSHWQLNIYFPIFLSLGFYQQPSRTRKYLEVPKGKRKNCRTISLVDWEVHNYSVSKLSIMYCCFKCRLLVTISKRWTNIFECYIFIIFTYSYRPPLQVWYNMYIFISAENCTQDNKYSILYFISTRGNNTQSCFIVCFKYSRSGIRHIKRFEQKIAIRNNKLLVFKNDIALACIEILTCSWKNIMVIYDWHGKIPLRKTMQNNYWFWYAVS